MACGPMSRDARDLPLLMSLLAGPDGEDGQVTGTWKLEHPATLDLSQVVVFPVPGNGRAFVRAPVQKAVAAAASALEDRGATARRLDAPDLGRSFEIWGALLSETTSEYDAIVGGGRRIRLLKELLAYPLGLSDHTASVLLILTLEKVLSALPGTEEVAAVADRLRAHLETTLGPNGVLIHPVVSRTAPRHRGMLLQSPFDVSLTTAFNITTLPCTVVPIHLDPRGLPIGVQVDPPLRHHRDLRVG